ncbi:hypothetical protein [Microbulbifer epialgicus]|uniref:Uncharacterized protein n=1 Tax=Microbulbifer epialgicus TaxID=393907 RepID=A0ABV4P314_9GAMM
MEISNHESYIVNYNVSVLIMAIVAVLTLFFFLYLFFVRAKSERLWELGIVKYLMGGAGVLTVLFSMMVVFNYFSVNNYREMLRLKSSKVRYTEGIPAYSKIPFSRKSPEGPQMGIANLGGIFFSIYRWPSPCINNRLQPRRKSPALLGNKIIYKAWYVEGNGGGAFEGLQDFEACLIKLDIVQI